MAYDEELAARIRELVGGEPDLTEQKMFGGLAFLVRGNMAVAASGQVRSESVANGLVVGVTATRLQRPLARSPRQVLRTFGFAGRGAS